jgi:hypothetical protein
MGLETATLALILAGTGTAATLVGQERSRKGASRSLAAQKQAASETNAQNAAAAAQERRQQIREERVRRARILQNSSNSGTAGSSGEAGAIGSLSTQLQTNIAANLGRLQGAENLSIFAQQQANAQSQINSGQSLSQFGNFINSNSGNFATIGNSIFSPSPMDFTLTAPNANGDF